MFDGHNCFDHLDYDESDEWYRCTICFKIYTVPEADRMVEAEAAKPAPYA